MRKWKFINIKTTIIILVLIFFIASIVSIKIYNNKIYPYVIEEAKVKANLEVTNLINEESQKIFREQYNYEEIVSINKNDKVNIIKTNTRALNDIISHLTIICNEKLKNIDDIKVKVPITWFGITSFFYDKGPSIDVSLSSMGSVSASYDSKFESSGINQTRHKIYLNVIVKVKIKVPFNREVVDISCEIPVAETIIVGEIPSTAIDFSKLVEISRKVL